MKINRLWKKTKTKIFIYFTIFITILVNNTMAVGANTVPSFDNSAAEELAGGWIDPATTFALWAIPSVTGLVLLIHGLTWLSKDEEEKEQKPYQKTAKKILIIAAVLMSISVILKILGIK